MTDQALNSNKEDTMNMHLQNERSSMSEVDRIS